MEEEGEREGGEIEELVLSICFPINPEAVPTRGA